MSTLTKENAIAILNNKKFVPGAGTYELQVSSVTPYVRETGENVTIVNYKGYTSGHMTGWVDPETGEAVPGIKQLLAEGKYDDACNLGISSTQRNGRDFIPAKGEYVKIRMEMRKTKSGVTGLFPVAVSPVEVKEATSFDFNSLFGDDKNEEEVITKTVDEATANVDAETANA